MAVTKVGTCCYCGTKAALVLKGKTRHELACRSCGAPLSRLKMLPNGAGAGTAAAPTPTRPSPRPSHFLEARSPRAKPKKGKRRKGLMAKIVEEAWDAIEDIFD